MLQTVPLLSVAIWKSNTEGWPFIIVISLLCMFSPESYIFTSFEVRIGVIIFHWKHLMPYILCSVTFSGCLYENQALIYFYLYLCFWLFDCTVQNIQSVFVLSGKSCTIKCQCESPQWFTRWSGWGEGSLPPTEVHHIDGEHRGLIWASRAALLGRVPVNIVWQSIFDTKISKFLLLKNTSSLYYLDKLICNSSY